MEELAQSYSRRLESGEAAAGEFDAPFWEGVRKEAEWDSKVTFVSEKGFHHAWRSELERLDGEVLMSILESNKDFLSANPNQKFLGYPPPKGYDPLALEREVRRTVAIVSELLEMKWSEQSSGEERRPTKNTHA